MPKQKTPMSIREHDRPHLVLRAENISQALTQMNSIFWYTNYKNFFETIIIFSNPISRSCSRTAPPKLGFEILKPSATKKSTPLAKINYGPTYLHPTSILPIKKSLQIIHSSDLENNRREKIIPPNQPFYVLCRTGEKMCKVASATVEARHPAV